MTGRDEEPRSPCVRLCQVDGEGVCIGCYRTLEEIVDWARKSPDDKRRILERVAARRAARGG